MTQRERQILELIAQNPMISQAELADTLGIARSSAAVHISNLIKKGHIVGKGYVLRTGSYAVVVGGANVDIGGRSRGALVAGDSNPGRVGLSIGGVGRNIAHNLSLLGADVRMLTAYGDDLYGEKLVSVCTAAGIDMSHAQKLRDEATSTYLYIAGPDGDMSLAVSDMAICDRIDPDYLASHYALLQNARVIVCDANIPAESLGYLTEQFHAPIFCDPVSTAKAEKLRRILGKLHTLKPNRIEAELLSGVRIESRADVETAARALLDTGLQRVFISLGADGVYAASQEERCWMENLPAKMVNTTGCGDSFMAALVWAYLEELSLEDSVRAGLAASSITIESAETISPDMGEELLRERMKHKSED
ncbi:MAG: winged helix-turn-helix transcriptional regulator [Ruminococcaceae bacterium]|nr:winged helix-turn-helix transcriptional regulator [Oscillospiraceae bacterium]